MIFPENISITIPLLIYHPMQIILGNYLTPRFQQWLRNAKYQWWVPRMMFFLCSMSRCCPFQASSDWRKSVIKRICADFCPKFDDKLDYLVMFSQSTFLSDSSIADMSTPSRLRLMRDSKQWVRSWSLSFLIAGFGRLQKDPPAGIAAVPSDDNILIWHAFILGSVVQPSDMRRISILVCLL